MDHEFLLTLRILFATFLILLSWVSMKYFKERRTK